MNLRAGPSEFKDRPSEFKDWPFEFKDLPFVFKDWPFEFKGWTHGIRIDLLNLTRFPLKGVLGVKGVLGAHEPRATMVS